MFLICDVFCMDTIM
ncbi:hypothetical protein ECTW14313_3913, partial [Escherichia coli O157:H7 str. TW14313]